MATWLILGAYAVGWLWTTRTVAMRMIDGEARTALEHREDWRKRFREPHSDDGKPLVDTEQRVLTTLLGAIVGLVWPLALLFLAAAKGMRTPTEVAEADRIELEALRKLAREHNLPMPGGDT